jgi:prevent-host-death family protein
MRPPRDGHETADGGKTGMATIPSLAAPLLAGASRASNSIDVAYENTYSAAFSRVITMTTLTASEARANLYRLIDQAAESHQPIHIAGKRTSAVLVSAEDWQSIQETLYLLSVPGMRESIKEGMAEPLGESATDLDW